jgi:uncharacterized membrane protein YfcA
MLMPTDPAFYIVAVLATVVVGVSKGGFAPGLGSLGIPIMALAIPPIQAAGIMLPILVTMDIVSVLSYRRSWDGWNLRVLMPASVIGTGAGWATASLMSDDGLRILIGVVAIAFVVWQTLKPVGPGGGHRPNPVLGVILGAVTGFTSFFANAGGPPAQIFLIPQRLPRTIFAGTFTMLFAFINATKIIPFALLGLLSLTNLTASTALLPLAVVSTWAGVRITRIVPERPFYVVAYLSMVAIGAWLLYDGLHRIAGF